MIEPVLAFCVLAILFGVITIWYLMRDTLQLWDSFIRLQGDYYKKVNDIYARLDAVEDDLDELTAEVRRWRQRSRSSE